MYSADRLSRLDRDLWTRVAGAALLLGAGWFSIHSERLLGLLGDSVHQVAIGAVAVSVLLALKSPFEFWTAPLRDSFSIKTGISTAVVIGLVIVASRSSGMTAQLLRENPGALVMTIVGGTVWASGFGAKHQRRSAKWYGIAAACALAPFVGAYVAGGWAMRETFELTALRFVQVSAFLVVVQSVSALVTLELAFRRVLIGKPGEASLATVLVSGLAFGAWFVMVQVDVANLPIALMSGTLIGLIAGGIFALSGSLLVSALYSGGLLGLALTLDATARMELPSFLLGQLLRSVVAINILIAAVLLVLVYRRSGLGLLVKLKVNDAAGG